MAEPNNQYEAIGPNPFGLDPRLSDAAWAAALAGTFLTPIPGDEALVAGAGGRALLSRSLGGRIFGAGARLGKGLFGAAGRAFNFGRNISFASDLLGLGDKDKKTEDNQESKRQAQQFIRSSSLGAGQEAYDDSPDVIQGESEAVSPYLPPSVSAPELIPPEPPPVTGDPTTDYIVRQLDAINSNISAIAGALTSSIIADEEYRQAVIAQQKGAVAARGQTRSRERTERRKGMMRYVREQAASRSVGAAKGVFSAAAPGLGAFGLLSAINALDGAKDWFGEQFDGLKDWWKNVWDKITGFDYGNLIDLDWWKNKTDELAPDWMKDLWSNVTGFDYSQLLQPDWWKNSIGSAFEWMQQGIGSMMGGSQEEKLKTKIRQAESGSDYGTLFRKYLEGFSRGDEKADQMSIGDVVKLQKDYLAYQESIGIPANKRSAAVGAYQMLYPDVAAKALGIPLTAKFDKAIQDRLADYYLNIAGYKDFKAGKITAEQFNDRLAGQFASLKKSSGKGAYDEDGLNKAYDSVLDILKSSDSGFVMPDLGLSEAASGVINQIQQFGSGVFEMLEPIIIDNSKKQSNSNTSQLSGGSGSIETLDPFNPNSTLYSPLLFGGN